MHRKISQSASKTGKQRYHGHFPATVKEMQALGWERPDVVIVTGDAFVDHPSFGAAVVARFLESLAVRVAVLPRPNWHSAHDFRRFGAPRLFFAVTSGNVDSMVTKYTSARRIRRNDDYAPDGKGGGRPDRAVIVYSQRIREAFPGPIEKGGVPIVIGGIEASLRRFAHFDYWSGKVRRSILADSKADMLIFGAGEHPLVELIERLRNGETWKEITDIRGTCILRTKIPDGWGISENIDPAIDSGNGKKARLILPSFTSVKENPHEFANATATIYRETNPFNAQPLIQETDNRYLLCNPPSFPLNTKELDAVYDLPFTRQVHPVHGNKKVPAFEMIKDSITISRGCYGGCSFCSIALHEGGIVRDRSEKSIIREAMKISSEVTFKGVISDLGGPTANMWGTGCESIEYQSACRKRSCLYPSICKHLITDQRALIRLYRKVRKINGIKSVRIASGIRHDLALTDREYIRELVTFHTGGQLKIAPEHVSRKVLNLMGKPPIEVTEQFMDVFRNINRKIKRKQFVLAYMIPAHPGSGDEEILEAALWLRKNGVRTRQIQEFLPTPMTLSTAMYHTGLNPLNPDEKIVVVRGDAARREQKTLLLFYLPENRKAVRKFLERTGRTDLLKKGDFFHPSR